MDFIISAAINHLALHSLSEKQLKVELLKKFSELPNSPSLIEFAMIRLKEMNVINDLRIALNFVQSFSHKGDCFIKQSLQQKGINVTDISKALATIDNESLRALQEMRKRQQSLYGICYEERKKILRRFLSGRGFSFSAIQSALGQVNHAEKLNTKRQYYSYTRAYPYL